jgi:phenylacetate 2-hydroxylase
MVSAGLDTVPGNLIMGIAYLSSPHGQEIQKRAYEEIMKVYPDGDAWERCLVEEKVPYVTAFVREVLRFFTVIPICLPRTSIKDIKYEDAVIPAGTTFYMVNPPSHPFIQPTNTPHRTPGPPISTQPTSKTPNPSS